MSRRTFFYRNYNGGILRMKTVLFGVAVFFNSLFQFACDSREGEGRGEVARFAFALTQVRDAGALELPGALRALGAEECDHHCALKELCFRAHSRRLRGVNALARAKKKLVFARAAMGEDVRLQAENEAKVLLEQAESEISRAYEEAVQCIELQGRWVRKYRL